MLRCSDGSIDQYAIMDGGHILASVEFVDNLPYVTGIRRTPIQFEGESGKRNLISVHFNGFVGASNDIIDHKHFMSYYFLDLEDANELIR